MKRIVAVMLFVLVGVLGMSAQTTRYSVSTVSKAATVGQVPVYSGTSVDWQIKGIVDARDYAGATPGDQIDAACLVAGSNKAVLVPSSMGSGSPTASNCNIIDFRTSTPNLFYLGYAASTGASFYRTSDNAGGLTTQIRSSVLARYGGEFDSGGQTPYAAGHFECRLRTKGQCTDLFTYGEGLGSGNNQGYNSVMWGMGGGGTPIGITASPFGEELYSEGRSFDGWSGLTSIFEGTISGSPATGATVITYSPSDGDTTDECLSDKAHGECVLGERPIYNLSHVTTTGTVTGVSTTTNTNDTFAFSGAPYWDAAASPCDNTAAGVHCNPVGQFIKTSSTQEDYATPCSGDDVSFPNDSTKCVGHFWLVAAVVDSTHLRLQEGWDAVNLNSAYPLTYMLVQGAVASKADTDNDQITLPANSYSWSNGDTLVQPPFHMGYFYGATITGTKVFKTNGTGWYDSGGLTIGSNGPADMRAGIDITGNFKSLLRLGGGSSNTPQYGIDIAGTYSGAHIHGGTGMKVSWGNDDAYIDLGAGNKFQFHAGQTDFGLTSKFSIHDGTTYTVIGTLTNNPFYFWTNGVIRGSLDTNGRLNIGENDNSLGYKFEVIGDAYTSGTLRSGVATGTPPLAVASTTKVTNLNADMTDGKHILSGTGTLDFAAITAPGCSTDLTITVTGASAGDPVSLGVPNGSIAAGVQFTAWVSASDTVTVRACAFSGTPDPASGTFTAVVTH